jgi:hypothetical protein
METPSALSERPPGAGCRAESRESLRRRYIETDNHLVEGWLGPMGIGLISALDRCQRALDVRGDVAEIGVHHGRLFLLLALSARDGEASLAIDVFDHQDLNIDRSGAGSYARFLANFDRFAAPLPRPNVLQADSLALDTARVLAASGGARFRLFSVDGGHTATHAAGDMALAASCLADGGVIILDDYFSPAWPGVSEGVGRLFALSPSIPIRPLAIAGNKIAFCTLSYHQTYRRMLREDADWPVLKTTTMFGADVLYYG